MFRVKTRVVIQTNEPEGPLAGPVRGRFDHAKVLRRFNTFSCPFRLKEVKATHPIRDAAGIHGKRS